MASTDPGPIIRPTTGGVQMTQDQIDQLISHLAFRAAMKKAFHWESPLAGNLLQALLSSAQIRRNIRAEPTRKRGLAQGL